MSRGIRNEIKGDGRAKGNGMGQKRAFRKVKEIHLAQMISEDT